MAERWKRTREKKPEAQLWKRERSLGLAGGGLACSSRQRWTPADPHHVQDAWWPPPSRRGAGPAACRVALQITACNLSAFEIIPVFLRIKLNPDSSSEPVYGSVPRVVLSLQLRGGKLWHGSTCSRAGPPRASSAAAGSPLDVHRLTVQEGLAFAPSNFYRFHCLLTGFLRTKSSDRFY